MATDRRLPRRGGTDLNRVVSRVLLAGLTLALGLMALGLGLELAGQGALGHRVVPFAELPGRLLRAEPLAFLSLGLIVLLATPALRVAVLLGGYVRRRDWLFALVSLAVLASLGLSAYLGVRG